MGIRFPRRPEDVKFPRPEDVRFPRPEDVKFPRPEDVRFPEVAREAFASGGLLLGAVVTLGERTDDGFLVEAVTLPWFEIVRFLMEDPERRFQIPWRKWEEMIAGAYRRAGFEIVTLTHRSGDHGRDVVAVKRDGGIMVGQVRIIDQVKAYGPGQLVPANDVRALMGVLFAEDRPASKAVLTTTADFAPRLLQDPAVARLVPHRLQLVNGIELLRRLAAAAEGTTKPAG